MNIKRPNGFSLVELLVVIAIISILAGYIVFRVNSNRYDVELESASNLLQSTLVRARDMARTPQQSGTIDSDSVVNGYGVSIPAVGSNDYFVRLFRDTVDNANPINQNKWVDPSTPADVIISTIHLRDSGINNVSIYRFFNDGAQDTSPGDKNIVFASNETPTKEDVYYNGINFSDAVGITLRHEITKKTISVFVTAREEIVIAGFNPTPGYTPSETVGVTSTPPDQRTGGDYDYSEFKEYVVINYPGIITSWGERQNGLYPSAYWTNINEVFDGDSNPAYLTWPNGWNDRGYIIADYGSQQNFNTVSVNFWTNNGLGNYPKVIIAASADGTSWTTVYFKQYPANNAPTSLTVITASLLNIKPRYIQLYYIMSGGSCGTGNCTASFDNLRLY